MKASSNFKTRLAASAACDGPCCHRKSLGRGGGNNVSPHLHNLPTDCVGPVQVGAVPSQEESGPEGNKVPTTQDLNSPAGVGTAPTVPVDVQVSSRRLFSVARY
jgi:hypothetical protein